MRCLLALVPLAAAATKDRCRGPSFCEQHGFHQVWADEFEAEELDAESWSVDLRGGDSRVRDSKGTRENVFLRDGELVLRSQKKQAGGYNYTSGAVESRSKRSFRGPARTCICARLPGGGGGQKGRGIWPAHWLMPDTHDCWPTGGEIDIMEMINGNGMLHGTYHFGERCHQNHARGGRTHLGHNWGGRYYEFAVEYSTEGIHFAVDGDVYFSVGKKEAALYDHPYYVILNTAVGGPWPGDPTPHTEFPTEHLIDYVRVAKRPHHEAKKGHHHEAEKGHRHEAEKAHHDGAEKGHHDLRALWA